MEAAAVCGEGNPVQRLRGEGVGKAGSVAVEVAFGGQRRRVGIRIGSRLRVGDGGRFGDGT
jgi:hypothetical protein